METGDEEVDAVRTTCGSGLGWSVDGRPLYGRLDGDASVYRAQYPGADGLARRLSAFAVAIERRGIVVGPGRIVVVKTPQLAELVVVVELESDFGLAELRTWPLWVTLRLRIP